MHARPGIVQMVRDRIADGRYTVTSHVQRHAAAENFGIRAVLTTVREGVIIEWMPERRRFLACARVRALDGRAIWLHVACDYTHPTDAGLVTAYIPDRREWEDPPIRRRR